MKDDFLKLCSMLLHRLAKVKVMSLDEVQECLNLDNNSALGVMCRLRADGLAGGIGWGNLSSTPLTQLMYMHYDEILSEKKSQKRREIMQDVGIIVTAVIAIASLVVSICK